MKRPLALLLSLILLISLVSCSRGLAEPPSSEESETVTEEAKTENEKDRSPITYPDAFSAGFAREKVTPDVSELPIMTNGGTKATYGHSIKSDLYVTCTALWDGEKVALLYNFDMKEIKDSFEKQGKKLLADEFGIPAEQVIFNATHSHTAPHGDSPAVTKFTKRCFEAVIDCAHTALRDLSPAKIFTGRGDTTGLAFVRRYVMADGTFKGIHSANPQIDYVEHETVADPELRTLRFARAAGKDIVMVNWQCHAASDGSLMVNGKNVVSADFIDKLREGVEQGADCHLIYLNGASGNINMRSEIEGRQTCKTTDQLGEAVAKVTLEALKHETEIASGPIRAARGTVTGTIRKDMKEREAAAAAERAAGNTARYTYKGIQSYYDEIHLGERARLPETQEIPLSVLAFGDVAFAAAPYEMCDGSGMELRAAVPYETTFVCGYSGGHFGYMATDDMFPHGEYEVYSCRFVSGTAEACVAKMVQMLTDLK